jgi:hypothetical protein
MERRGEREQRRIGEWEQGRMGEEEMGRKGEGKQKIPSASWRTNYK